MAAVKHELIDVKQIQYPGGKNGMWRGNCTCGQYMTPVMASEKDVEKTHAAHAYSRSQAVMTSQKFELEDGESAELTMGTDKNCKTVELGVEKTDRFGEKTWAYTQLTYDELWEHVHDCLDALQVLGGKK